MRENQSGGFNGLKIIPAFFLVIAALFVISCSQTVPDILLADYSVIFDYPDEESLPSARLGVFVVSESDVRRYSAITLVSKASGLVWETSDILRIQESDMQWAGNVSFVMPEAEIIPSGLYEVTFMNADEKSDSVEFNVQYSAQYYKTLCGDVPALMRTQGGSSQIAIYDRGGKMLYFGERYPELRTVRGILNDYTDAGFFQDVWCSADNSVMCIMPEKPVSLE